MVSHQLQNVAEVISELPRHDSYAPLSSWRRKHEESWVHNKPHMNSDKVVTPLDIELLRSHFISGQPLDITPEEASYLMQTQEALPLRLVAGYLVEPLSDHEGNINVGTTEGNQQYWSAKEVLLHVSGIITQVIRPAKRYRGQTLNSNSIYSPDTSTETWRFIYQLSETSQLQYNLTKHITIMGSDTILTHDFLPQRNS